MKVKNLFIALLITEGIIIFAYANVVLLSYLKGIFGV